MSTLAAAVGPTSDAPYRLDGAQMERLGRRRTYRRTLLVALFLLLLQQPLRMVATGEWESSRRLDPVVPARLSLLADAAMVAAYVVAAVRAFELARARPARGSSRRADALLALVLVGVGALLDLVENAQLWRQVGDATFREPADLSVALTEPMRAVVVAGLLLGWVAAAWVGEGPGEQPGESPPEVETRAGDVARPGLVICCSGGGIRAASFCLGGLQGLGPQYARADAVIGVSGGGYMAAAQHVLRWRSGRDRDETWAEVSPAAYARDSPEEKWLQRHTRYLLDSTRVGVVAVLSLLFGLAVNLLLVVALLGGTAWVVGWFLLASGGVSRWSTTAPRAADYTGDWAWAGWSWLVLAAGVGLFVVAKVVDRAVSWLDVAGRERVRTVIARLVVGGLLALVVTHGLPWLLVGLRALADSDSTAPVTSALSGLVAAMGFAAPSPGESLAMPPQAAGREVSVISFAGIAAAVVATVRAFGSVLSGGESGTGSATRRVAGRLWRAVRRVVLPWLAAVLVVVLLLVVFLTWTVALLNDSALLSRWELAWVYGGLLLATLVLTDANRTSLHHFYRERLSSAYLVRRGRWGRPENVDYAQALRFSDAAPPPGRGPGLVSCAVANVNDRDVVPTDRGCTPFVLDHDQMGLTEEILPPQARVASATYEFAADSAGRDATIPAAMAISGAAFSPLAGRESSRLAPYRLVLALANARLGVWLPNPLWVDPEAVERRRLRAKESALWRFLEWVRSLVTKPSAWLVGREAVGRTSVLDRFLYVTDGGHYDNLGLVEALRREPEQVVVLDASDDPEDSFRTFGRAVATARMDLGCDVDLDPRSMQRVGSGRPSSGWAQGTITYRRRDPDGRRLTGQLWLAKAVLVDGLPWDLETYHRDHPDFPGTSTADQLYGEFDLEAYRALGAEVVRTMVARDSDLRPGGPPGE